MFPPVGVQSFTVRDHTYQLIRQYQRYHPHQGGGKYTYTILECDSFGLLCRAYRPAYQTVYTPTGNGPYICFPDAEAKSGRLDQYSYFPATESFTLTVGSDVHLIDPSEDMFVYEACSPGGYNR
jgi:hypothetical protein